MLKGDSMIEHKAKKIIYKYSYSALMQDIEKIVKEIQRLNWKPLYVYGPPRGGCILAVILSHRLNLKYLTSLDEKHNMKRTIIVDDVSDTGVTLNTIEHINKYKTITLFLKPGTAHIPNIHIREIPRRYWIVYWWENDYN